MFINVAVLSSASLILVNADTDFYPEHSPLIMGSLGARINDGGREHLSNKCISETNKLHDINPFLDGLLDDAENDDVQYDDYDNYHEKVNCYQKQNNDIICDWSDFTSATSKCVNRGGVRHRLKGIEKCVYGDEGNFIETKAVSKNMFICIGRSCIVQNVVNQLSEDADAAYDKTKCTFSYSYK